MVCVPILLLTGFQFVRPPFPSPPLPSPTYPPSIHPLTYLSLARSIPPIILTLASSLGIQHALPPTNSQIPRPPLPPP